MISRRKLVAGSVGGLLFGLTGIALMQGDASIRFIGRRQTIIALLDTSTEQVIFVLGERDDELLANIPGLTTISNTRIDLVIATHRILATQAAKEHLGTDSGRTLALQANYSLPPIRGSVTTITETVTLDLGSKASLDIAITGTQADHPDFLVTISSRETRLLLASSLDALRINEVGSPELLALPGSAEVLSDSDVSPQVVVCNIPDNSLDLRQMEVFPTEPTIIRIGDGSISLRDDQVSS